MVCAGVMIVVRVTVVVAVDIFVVVSDTVLLFPTRLSLYIVDVMCVNVAVDCCGSDCGRCC